MTPSRDRLMELLAERATQRLTPDHARELQALLIEHPQVDPESLDRAAAALNVALAPAAAPPASLAARLNAAADRYVSESQPPVAGRVEPKSRAKALMWAGWLAAAACLSFAIITRFLPTPDAASLRLAMIGTPGASQGAWAPFELPNSPAPVITGVQGDVVWDEARQSGYMRFTGLPVNDTTKAQYQVWLVDARGMNFRISGGVFDSTSTGEIVVPITPAIRTSGVAAVAVTVESPGGVVVSDMTKRVVIASPKKS